MIQSYDIIGDIHGHADELESLLNKLGYRESGTSYQHPKGRRVLFLGDYLDRGPQIRRTLEVVRAMVKSDNALAILGNHEINALRYHSIGSDGTPLREHSAKNTNQLRHTLDQLCIADPDDWSRWMHWLARLPLWLDLGHLRAVHASWSKDAISTTRDIGPLESTTLEKFSQPNSHQRAMLTLLLNGPEAPLEGNREVEIHGKARRAVRVRWWETSHPLNTRDAVYPPDASVDALPIEPINITGYAPDQPPVFFGHYSSSLEHAIVAPNVACLDHRVGKGGHLSAYRWDGESTLSADKITY